MCGVLLLLLLLLLPFHFHFPHFSLSPILPLYTPHLSHFSFSSPFFSLKLQFPILPLTVDPPFALAPIPRLVSWNAPFWGLRRWFALSDVLKLINLLSLSLSILGTGFSVFTVPLSFRAQFSFRFAARKTTSFLDFGVASYSGNYRLVSSVRSCSPFLVFCSVENLDLLNLCIIKIKIKIFKNGPNQGFRLRSLFHHIFFTNTLLTHAVTIVVTERNPIIC